MFSAAYPAGIDHGGRLAMNEKARAEIAILTLSEAAPGTLGEWNDIISDSLFLLFRHTELFRGGMRVLVVENTAVFARMYPEGTFALSTGLLDYIDESLFESAADSTRRLRNFDSEREAVLFPFLVIEAAHFALDHQFTAYERNSTTGISAGSDPFRYSAAEVFQADRFSHILLSLAEFDPLLCDQLLSSLDAIYASSPANPAFAAYFQGLPSPSVRLATLANSSKNLPKITAEFSAVLSSLRSGLALTEASDSLAALAETYPASPWLDRLEAIVLHRLWLATVPERIQRLKTFFPVAAECDPSTTAFHDLFNDVRPEFPASRTGSKKNFLSGGTIPGDVNLYEAARVAYQKDADTQSDSGLAPSRAMLLAWTDDEAALQMAENAATAETGSRDVTARANYASLLYLTGTDYARAQYLLDALPGRQRQLGIDRGIPGDERDILLNSALMLRPLGDLSRSLEKKKAFDRLYLPSAPVGTISFRQITVADTADTLASKWGRPTEIIYNYVTENWNYPSLSASVLLGSDPAVPGRQIIHRIRFGTGSPLTPGNDIRAGDSRNDFESVFGKSVYRAGDFEVYLKDGNRISVFYLSDKIRSVTAGL